MDIKKTIKKATTNLAAALEALAEKRKAAEESAQKEAKDLLGPGFSEFMEEHPKVLGIAWTQYTPYWNDGETCEFRMGDIYVLLDDGKEHDDFCGYDENGWQYIGPEVETFLGKAEFKALDKLSSALAAAESELQAAFGDHVQVIVTADGIDVSEYEHD